MIGYSDAPRAWGFTRGMSRALGYSLTEAVIEGWLSRAELGRLVDTCQNCGATQDCNAWLSKTVDAQELPGFCPNAAALEALKP